MLVRVDQLLPGDQVYLEGDRFADLQVVDSFFHNYLAQVVSVMRETEEHVRVEFEFDHVVDFPPDHEVGIPGTPEFADRTRRRPGALIVGDYVGAYRGPTRGRPVMEPRVGHENERTVRTCRIPLGVVTRAIQLED